VDAIKNELTNFELKIGFDELLIYIYPND